MKYLAILLLVLTGCATRHAVITSTGTTLGLELAENPATGLYQVKFGYARAEYAYVPSNRSSGTNEASFAGGASDVPDVLMELRFQNIFKGGDLYQRLAVGANAVSQPGAAFMFAKGPDGKIDVQAVDAVSKAIRAVPETKPDQAAAMADMARAYIVSTDKPKWDVVADGQGFPDFQTFLTTGRSAAQIAAMAAALKSKGLLP
jgi:hypothetical protein